MEISNNISKTAFLTCLSRSLDNKSNKPIIHDKFAHLFLENSLGRKITREFRSNRLFHLAICTRHQLIDEVIVETSKNKKTWVINIGCGLDTRPYRIATNVDYWLELDTKDIIDFKNSVLPENHQAVQTTLKRVKIDFANDLLSDVIKENTPTEIFDEVIVIFEGVFTYLSLGVIQNNMNELRKIFNNFKIVFDYLDQEIVNKWSKKIERQINEKLDAKFTFFPNSVDGFLNDINFEKISYNQLSHGILKYKLEFLPYKFLIKILPKNTKGGGVVFAKNSCKK